MFRFEDLDVWKKSIAINDVLFELADELAERKLYRFAEQLRAAGLSISNNIAEGSGSASKKEFKQFLNVARRSAFEVVSMLMIFFRRKYISEGRRESIVQEIEVLCKMITNFRRVL